MSFIVIVKLKLNFLNHKFYINEDFKIQFAFFVWITIDQKEI